MPGSPGPILYRVADIFSSPRTLGAIALIGGGFILGSCEKDPGTAVDPPVHSLFLSSGSLALSTLNLDDTTLTSYVSKLPNGYRITDTVEATCPAAGSSLTDHLTFSLAYPGQTQHFASGSLGKIASSDPNVSMYRGVVTFDLQRSDVGNYAVEVASPASLGLAGNSIILTLNVTRNNSRPRLFLMSAPDTVKRPVTDTIHVAFSVSVSDSDGYGDITDVYLKVIAPVPSPEVPLYDDGDFLYHGDRVAGDGIFANILEVSQFNNLGTRTLLFEALDKSGAMSDSLLHSFTIIQGP